MTTESGPQPIIFSGNPLDVAFAKAQSAASSLSKTIASIKPRVVFLEDDNTYRRAIARQLGRNVELVTTSSPKEALRLLADEEADLFLTDSVGLLVVPEVKRRFPHVPVVVLSGSSPPRDMPLGVDAWKQKPLGQAEALILIQTHARGLLE